MTPVPDGLRHLTPGSSVGPYRIDALIGTGGMGQVYRARDPRIGRDVAVKVLPPAFASDAERLRRFELEARAAGALNDPNIVTIYDVGAADGCPYLVMELVDGETLRDRVRRGALPVRRACEVAAAIAHGLAAAHARNIVHRDLKPENVIVARDGRVKILDFGIAKLREPHPAVERDTELPTYTAPNAVLGTAGYMAPEQIRGQPTDGRADLFALGAILFELLTARRAFDRGSSVETLNAVLNDETPAASSAGARVPASLDRIVQRCLEKDPDARFQSARDLAFALEATTGTGQTAALRAAPPGRTLGWQVAAASALLAIGFAAGMLWRGNSARRALPMRPLARFALAPPAGLRFLGPPAISPDGALVVFPAGEGPIEKQRLYLRRADQTATTALPGTEGGNFPFFSPDGRAIGFISGDTLKTISVDAASSPAAVCVVDGLFLGGTWTSDGTIIFGSINHPLQRVPAAGGVPRPLTAINRSKSEIDHRAPKMLPGDRALLLTVHDGSDRFHVEVLTLATGTRRTVIEKGFDPVYMPTGHLVYGEGSALLDVPFDLDSLEVTGPPVRLIDDAMTSSNDGMTMFALSPTGTLVVRTPVPLVRRTLAWADRSGATTPIPIEPRKYWTPRLSPDGRQFAVVVEEQGRRDLWVYRFDNSVFSPVTFDGLNRAPGWTGDGKRLVYFSEQKGRRHLMWQPPDATAPAESLLSSENDDYLPGSASADRGSLVYTVRPPTDESTFRVLPIEGRQPTAVAGLPTRISYPMLSPDGRWLAFMMWNSGGVAGRPGIYVMPFPGPGQYRRLVEAAGQPVWSRSGDRLFFRTRRGAPPGSAPGEGIFELPFDRERGVAAGPERQLFRQPFPEDSPWWGVPGFDVAADGRFLIVIADESESFGGAMNMLLHVDDELRRQRR